MTKCINQALIQATATTRFYKPTDIDSVMDMASVGCSTVYTGVSKLFNIPCSFDIETSSFYEDGVKKAIMYMWAFGLNGYVIIGRTWQEFIDVLTHISERWKLNEKKRLLCYVHNLAYEFQFMRLWFDWTQVFNTDKRQVLYCINSLGIEFRCSYLLSGYGLAKLGENLVTYKCRKMVGDLDYSLLRHSNTAITDTEYGYQYNDVVVVMCYIQEQIDEYGDIGKIPYTNTGRVRNYCRNACFYEENEQHKKVSKKREKYREFIRNLTLTVPEYKQQNRAFSGGFTHCSPCYVMKECYNVDSIDFTSAYPFCMVAEMYPVSNAEYFENVSRETFEESIKYYCCIFDIEILDIDTDVIIENYISVSKCPVCEKPVVANGRLVSSKRIVTTITNVDWDIIRTTYTFKSFTVKNLRRYKKGYLPTDFVKSILTLYEKKVVLKGIAQQDESKYIEFMRSKGMLNSCYGMTCQAVYNDNGKYENGQWIDNPPDVDKAIDDYNKNRKRFLYYAWGLFVCAYNRSHLFTGIKEFGRTGDYIYSDTDSIKCMCFENHTDYVNKYNQWVRDKLEKAMRYHNLPMDLCEPMDEKGNKKLMGVWDWETSPDKGGKYTRFKSLGAKRYMYEQDGKIHLTVSGLNKKIVVPYLVRTFGNNDAVFKHFNDGLDVPAEYTGKQTHTYVDDEIQGVVTDYNGMVGEYHEKSFIHLENAPYSLSMAQEFVDFCNSIQTSLDAE